LPPKGVIFDIGRVIVRLDLMRAVGPLALAQVPKAGDGDAVSATALWSAIIKDARWCDWQEGRMTPREWHDHITRALGVTLKFAEFCETWNRALHPEPILDDRLFAELSRQCRLGLLSNTDPLHVEHMEKHFTFGRYFTTRIYSCAVGTSKPSPTIYKLAVEAMGLSPADVVYVDDVAEFVDAARSYGLDAIQFRDRSDVVGHLRSRGLLLTV
jgi:HAD superfamily hydrolase (TIGR01509 family)